MATEHEQAIIGCLLGTAVGDALGLPCEGMSPHRQLKWFPSLDRHHFLFGYGMTSDDTEHTCMVAQALLVSGGEPERFAKSLRWRLRWWLLGLPAGIGRATLRSIVKLWFGGQEGVFSAGNGPAMRSAILGVCFGHDRELLRQLVRLSTRITHIDPKAEYGAFAVALAAHYGSTKASIEPEQFVNELRESLPEESAEFLKLVEQAKDSAIRGETARQFAESLGLKRGVTGYIYHTVPVVLQVWFRDNQRYREPIVDLIRAGGDSDTTAAILGGILGAGTGREAIPDAWLKGICEWPRSVKWMEKLGRRLSTLEAGQPQNTVWLFVPGLLLRNLIFLIAVLFHIILPPLNIVAWFRSPASGGT